MDAPRRPIAPEDLLAQAGWVRTLARRLMRDDADGDDVAQQSFVAAIERPPRGPAAAGPWIAGVVKHLAWKARRSADRRGRHEALAAPRPLPESPADVAARAEAFRAVVEAVVALEPIYRDAIVLRHFDGLALPEVAARMGVPVETARTRIRRALATLRDRLRASGHGEAAWLVVAGGGAAGADTASDNPRDASSADPRNASPGPRRIPGSPVSVPAALVACVLVAFGVWVAATRSSGADVAQALRVAHDDASESVERPSPPARTPAPPTTSTRPRAAAPETSARGAVVAESPPGVDALDAATTLVVRVVDADRRPVAEMPVGIQHDGRHEWGRTDADGAWRCARAAVAGSVYINPEHAVGGRWFLDASGAVTPDDAGVTLLAVDARRVEGRVEAPDGTPLPLLEIEVLLAGVRNTKTNSEAEGAFAVRLPAAGRADVALSGLRYVRCGGYGGPVELSTPGPDGAPLPNDFRIEHGGAVVAAQGAVPSPWEGRLADVGPGVADIVLRAHPVPRDATLDVIVVDPAGAPIAGVHVTPNPLSGTWSRSTADATTGADGRVRLAGLERRKLRVDAWVLPPSEAARDWLAPLHVEVVPRGQEVTLAFRAALAVAGVVEDADGAPAPSAIVRVFADGANAAATPLAETTAGPDGAFRLLVALDGPRALRVEAHAGALTARAPGVAAGSVGLRLVLRAD